MINFTKNYYNIAIIYVDIDYPNFLAKLLLANEALSCTQLYYHLQNNKHDFQNTACTIILDSKIIYFKEFHKSKILDGVNPLCTGEKTTIWL